MKHQAINSPRIWSTSASTDPTALGATVQPHFLLDVHGGVDVGVKPLVKTEEQHAGHSFDELGCLCEHNWVCGNCFAWNRGTHSQKKKVLCTSSFVYYTKLRSNILWQKKNS